MKNYILIIGQYPDAHIDRVVTYLESLSEKVIIFNRYSDHDQISLYFNSKKEDIFFIKSISSINIKSVWWWFKPFIPSEFSGNLGPVLERLIVQEWHSILKALPYIINNAKWINSFHHQQNMNWKINQLKLAQKYDLLIPPTLISNSFDEVSLFAQKYEKIIYKTLSSFFIYPDKLIYINQINLNDLLKNKDSFSLLPGIFQQQIEKEHELRITIINEEIYIAKINSQLQQETKIDWRRNQIPQMFEIGELSVSTLKKLTEFHQASGLTYAAYDFIVTKDKQEIFLECNPSGQWLWLEDILNFPISKKIGGALAHKTV